jgi:hypothetical protein
MKIEEIQEHNKQIALMLGWEIVPTKSDELLFKNSRNHEYYEYKLKFHSDWNWLMEAIDFIKALQKDWPLATSDVCDSLVTTPIEGMFIRVGNFAKKYNEWMES